MRVLIGCETSEVASACADQWGGWAEDETLTKEIHQ